MFIVQRKPIYMFIWPVAVTYIEILMEYIIEALG